MSTLTHPLQHISGKNHDRLLKRSRRHCYLGGRSITRPRFADGIDSLAGEKEELTKLAECLDNASTAYGDQSRVVQADDKQHTWHQHRDQSGCTEA